MTEKGRTRLKPILAGVAVLLVLGLVAFGYWWFDLRGVVSTDDAQVAAYLVDIPAEVPARITQVDVEVGSEIHEGEVLFRLDPETFQAQVKTAEDALSLAKAHVAAAQANLLKAQHGPRPDEIRMAQAAVQRLKAQVHLAELSLERAKQLHAAGSASRSTVDKASAELQVDQSSEQQAEQQLALLKQGTRREDIAAAQAAVQSAQAGVEQAQSAVNQAQIALSKTVVTAPFDGIVVNRWRDPGDTASPGVPILTVFQPSTLRVDANVKETDLYLIRLGAPVDISVDAFPDMNLHGHVVTVVKATQAALSPIPSSGSSGTFVKVTQRVPVRIELDGLPKGVDPDSLLPGLSVEVRIHEGAPAAGAKLAKE